MLELHQFNKSKCYSETFRYLAGVKLKWRGEFKCPSITNYVGNKRSLKSQQGALEHSAFDLMTHLINMKRVTKQDLENFLKEYFDKK